jgi:hypothetical protein
VRDELAQAFLQRSALQQDAPATAEATQADVGAETDDLPVEATAGVRLAKPDDIAEVQLENRG